MTEKFSQRIYTNGDTIQVLYFATEMILNNNIVLTSPKKSPKKGLQEADAEWYMRGLVL